MATFRVLDHTGNAHLVPDADTYAPDGPLTTFYATRRSTGPIDSWSRRVASFRTADIVMIELVGQACSTDAQGTYAPERANAHRPIASAPPAAYTAGSARSRPSSVSAPATANGNALVA